MAGKAILYIEKAQELLEEMMAHAPRWEHNPLISPHLVYSGGRFCSDDCETPILWRFCRNLKTTIYDVPSCRL